MQELAAKRWQPLPLGGKWGAAGKSGELRWQGAPRAQSRVAAPAQLRHRLRLSQQLFHFPAAWLGARGAGATPGAQAASRGAAAPSVRPSLLHTQLLPTLVSMLSKNNQRNERWTPGPALKCSKPRTVRGTGTIAGARAQTPVSKSRAGWGHSQPTVKAGSSGI